MSTQKYEIEHVALTEDDGFMLALISMLTGLPMEELRERLDARYYRGAGFWGRDFKDAFRLLGYDCSPRFKKFDPDTPVPCLLRFGPTKRQMVVEGIKRPWWSVVVYYDGQVYDPHTPGPWAYEHWNHQLHKVTSMMPVWISNL